VEGDLAAVDGQGSVLVIDGAASAAVGARLLGFQRLGLLFQEGVEGPLGQADCGGRGDLLHRLEVELGVRARRLDRATGDDFSPLSRQVMNLLQFLR
jgi:hypothetical protein